jgi:hypothetical protein
MINTQDTSPSKGDFPTSNFQGFQGPNFTQVPNVFFDEHLPTLNGTEAKVLMYVIRKTFGWGKESDTISREQFLSGIIKHDGTRLDSGAGVSQASLIRALETLKERGLLICESQKDSNGRDLPNLYKLNLLIEQAPIEQGSKNDTPLIHFEASGGLKTDDTKETQNKESVCVQPAPKSALNANPTKPNISSHTNPNQTPPENQSNPLTAHPEPAIRRALTDINIYSRIKQLGISDEINYQLVEEALANRGDQAETYLKNWLDFLVSNNRAARIVDSPAGFFRRMVEENNEPPAPSTKSNRTSSGFTAVKQLLAHLDQSSEPESSTESETTPTGDIDQTLTNTDEELPASLESIVAPSEPAIDPFLKSVLRSVDRANFQKLRSAKRNTSGDVLTVTFYGPAPADNLDHWLPALALHGISQVLIQQTQVGESEVNYDE